MDGIWSVKVSARGKWSTEPVHQEIVREDFMNARIEADAQVAAPVVSRQTGSGHEAAPTHWRSIPASFVTVAQSSRQASEMILSMEQFPASRIAGALRGRSTEMAES
jgi:hypothetical protein